MTDKEIIKALEYCTNNYGHCENCPYRENEKGIYCVRYLPQNALDLINRQQETIERLKEEVKAEYGATFLAKAEAIKEFAERLKINYSKPLFAVGSYNEFIREVDNLVKEMVGEDK